MNNYFVRKRNYFTAAKICSSTLLLLLLLLFFIVNTIGTDSNTGIFISLKNH